MPDDDEAYEWTDEPTACHAPAMSSTHRGEETQELSEDQPGRTGTRPEEPRDSKATMATMPHYKINGTRCDRCGNEGPVVLDPDAEFVVKQGGTIDFPEGEWGLDIGCGCPACGFSARLGDFYEWVEVSRRDRSISRRPGGTPGSRTNTVTMTRKGTGKSGILSSKTTLN